MGAPKGAGRSGAHDPVPGAARPKRSETATPPVGRANGAAGAVPAVDAPPAEPAQGERAATVVRQRREARAQFRAHQDRRRLQRRVGLGALAAILVVVVAVAVYSFVGGSNGSGPPAFDEVRTYTGSAVDRGHVQGKVTYKVIPPVGGKHNDVVQNCGVYDKPVANENVVHSLEHGAVWLTYQPTLPADQIAKLKALGSEPFTLVSPYPGIKAPVIATSWGKQVWLKSADDPALNDFIQKYRQGPDTPEPGASCSGGTSATVDTP